MKTYFVTNISKKFRVIDPESIEKLNVLQYYAIGRAQGEYEKTKTFKAANAAFKLWKNAAFNNLTIKGKEVLKFVTILEKAYEVSHCYEFIEYTWWNDAFRHVTPNGVYTPRMGLEQGPWVYLWVDPVKPLP